MSFRSRLESQVRVKSEKQSHYTQGAVTEGTPQITSIMVFTPLLGQCAVYTGVSLSHAQSWSTWIRWIKMSEPMHFSWQCPTETHELSLPVTTGDL